MPRGNFNLEREVFRDLRVRKAFAHAIDRKVLASNGFFGFAKLGTVRAAPREVDVFDVSLHGAAR